MPTTVNGIGTHYYGRSDSSSRTGTCQHCRAHVRLETYTTRLWFVIIFIPIIPLKRVRLIDYCPQCQRHWVADPEQYEMSRQLAVSGAMDKYRENPSVDAALTVHAQFMSFHMHDEADRFRQAALDAYPKSAELRAVLGSHLDYMNRWNDATPLYEEAYQLQPEVPEVRAALAWRRENVGQLDEAFELLDFMRQPGAGQTFNLGQLESLAVAYQGKNNHERALVLLAHLLREFPAAGERHDFRKLITKSERALNLPTSILPQQSFSLKGLFDSRSGRYSTGVRTTVIGSIAAVLFVAFMMGLNEYRRTHRTLYVVNGFATPVNVSIDGGPSVPVSTRSSFPLSEGKHTLSLTGPVTRQAEIDLQAEYWRRWLSSPVWVFNVEKAVAITFSKIHYAEFPKPSEHQWLEKEFSYVTHADYVFETPPQTMQVKRNETITKSALQIISLPQTSMLIALGMNPDKNVSMTYAEGHLQQNPNDSMLLYMYVGRAEGDELQGRVERFLKEGLWRKPLSIPWHRTYQSLKHIRGREELLAAEYDEKLKETPDDASLIYLRGRVGSTRADQIEHYRKALERNPQLGWPAMGLSYDAANRGEWLESRDWCEKAAPTLMSDPSFRGFRHVVRLANGETDAMVNEYRQQLASADYTTAIITLYLLADSLASQQKCDDLRNTVHNWLASKTQGGSTQEALEEFNPMLDYLCGDEEKIRERLTGKSSSGKADYRFFGWLAIGDPDAAIKIEGVDLTEQWEHILSVSLAYSLAGNEAEADAWRKKACDAMAAEGSDYQRAANLLLRDTPPTTEEIDDVMLQLADTSLVLAILARRFPDRRGELNERAGKLNVSRMHPYLLVKKAIAQP